MNRELQEIPLGFLRNFLNWSNMILYLLLIKT